jgi:hypothetical protein
MEITISKSLSRISDLNLRFSTLLDSRTPPMLRALKMANKLGVINGLQWKTMPFLD